MITETEIQLIKNSEYETLYKWWDKLNSWGWPDELLPSEDPKERANGRRGALMQLIKNKVGMKYLLWEHNRKDMSVDEFEDFWQGSECGDKKAFERYLERGVNKLNP